MCKTTGALQVPDGRTDASTLGTTHSTAGAEQRLQLKVYIPMLPIVHRGGRHYEGRESSANSNKLDRGRHKSEREVLFYNELLQGRDNVPKGRIKGSTVTAAIS